MVKNERVEAARRVLIDDWRESGERVAEAAARAKSYNDSFEKFWREDCNSRGGSIEQIMLSGIRALWPEVYAAMPEDLGLFAYARICSVLVLCGVQMTI